MILSRELRIWRLRCDPRIENTLEHAYVRKEKSGREELISHRNCRAETGARKYLTYELCLYICTQQFTIIILVSIQVILSYFLNSLLICFFTYDYIYAYVCV